MYCRQITEPSKSLSEQKSSERAEGGGSFENEALENEDRSTKHPNLENEAPKTRKRSTQNSKTKTPKTRNRSVLYKQRLMLKHKHVCVPKKCILR